MICKMVTHLLLRLIVNKVGKLIRNLKKKKYILHRRNLELYISLGLKIKDIHRGITFKEKQWMKSYIELNTELRKKVKGLEVFSICFRSFDLEYPKELHDLQNGYPLAPEIDCK